MRTLNPFQILFYDEASFSSGNCHRYWGSAPKGSRAVEVSRHYKGESHTLFLICGLNGKVFGKVTEGSSTTQTFIEFMLEALQAYDDNSEPLIQPNFWVVGDNARIHRYGGENLLREIFDPYNINIAYLPVCSPTENPVEMAFAFIKNILKEEPLSSILQNDVPSAILEATGLLTPSHIYSYFKGVSNNYMNL